jgi:hypothetical protein
VCGDASFCYESLMSDCEARGEKDLFRLRRSTGVKPLITLLEGQGGWRVGVNGWSGLEGRLQLSSWSVKRRVVVLRRPKERAAVPAADPRALPWPAIPSPAWVLATGTSRFLGVARGWKVPCGLNAPEW